MPVYRVSGVAFRSTVVFPELDPVGQVVPQVHFGLAASAPDGWRARRWYHRWIAPDGREWARFARAPRGYLVRFPRLADFLVSSDATEARCVRSEGVSMDSVRHLFLHQVLPLLLGERGYLVLHASAVATPAGAVAFLGDAGRGKSTLAASFWAAGCPLVADDCLRIDERGGELVAVPAYPAVRLWRGALRRLPIEPPPARWLRAAKVVVPADRRRRFARAAVGLARVYVLGRRLPPSAPAAARIERLSAREAMGELIAHAYRLDLGVGRPEALARDFDRLAATAARLSARRLRLRRGLTRLDEVREAIVADLGGWQW